MNYDALVETQACLICKHMSDCPLRSARVNNSYYIEGSTVAHYPYCPRWETDITRDHNEAVIKKLDKIIEWLEKIYMEIPSIS